MPTADHDSLRFEQLDAERVQPLRTQILRPHFEAGRLCEFEQDEDEDTVHYGLVDAADRVVAVATFFPQPCPEKPQPEALRLRGMCVEPVLQGMGLGQRLLDGALGRLAVRFPSADIVWCNARVSAAPFYEKLGFDPIGEVFEVEAIGAHVVMWRNMPAAIA